MTNQHQKVPLHGGTRRISINGGESTRQSLPFNAVSVNIDNLSPYWYKLNPVDVYIPPFQIDKTVRLPFVRDFEFIPLAPPGLEQELIVLSTAHQGNSKPLIAVFTSQEADNNSGESALEQAANISNNLAFASVANNTAILTLDLTLYNGVYISLQSQSNGIPPAPEGYFTASFQFGNDTGNFNTFHTYHYYPGQSILWTFPKLGKRFRIVVNSDTGVNIEYGLQFRPFLGYANFNKSIVKPGSIGTAGPGDVKQITTSGTIIFNASGYNNAIVVVKTQNAGGILSTSVIRVFVTLANYVIGTTIVLHRRTYVFGDGTHGLILPIFNVLQGVQNNLNVFVSGPANSIHDVSLHEVQDYAALGNSLDAFSVPYPYTDVRQFTLLGPGGAILFAIPTTGTLVSLAVTITTVSAAAADLTIGVGSAGAFLYPLLNVDANVSDTHILQLQFPISGAVSNTMWANLNGAGATCSFSYSIIIV